MARISQEKKEETRTAIIEESYQLFRDIGYSRTNIKSIARRCHIAEGTIFNYFATKDDILMAIFENLSSQGDGTEPPSSLTPADVILDTFMIPLRKLSRMPKSFVIDVFISALKLSKKENHLLNRLLLVDASYVKKAEEKMNLLLQFQPAGMTASMLSEILYATAVTEYFLYIFNESMSFDELEYAIRGKLRLLIQPYQKVANGQTREVPYP